MLKKYRNDLLQAIQDGGYKKERFVLTERQITDKHISTTIIFTGSQHAFEATQSEHSFDSFTMSYTRFQPHPVLLAPNTGNVSYTVLKRHFLDWLANCITPYLQEEESLDLWSIGDNASSLFEEEVSNENFTEQEKERTRQALSEFKAYVLETHAVTSEQKNDIEVKIDYLVGAVDRLNKFDWKGIAVSTVISIITTLSLDSQKGSALWNFFVGLLKHMPQLIHGS